MTDLSPAAQAVLDAANGASCYEYPYQYVPEDCLNEAHRIAAAALRAAGNYVPDHQMSAHTLYAIADELEGAQ